MHKINYKVKQMQTKERQMAEISSSSISINYDDSNTNNQEK